MKNRSASRALNKLIWLIPVMTSATVLGSMLLIGSLIGPSSTALAVQAEKLGKFNMSYLYFGSPQSYADQVAQTKGSVDVVSPSYLDLTADGNLQLSSSIDGSFVEEMHEEGVRVVPFLSNHWDRDIGVKALANREALVKQIVQAVKSYNLDGVNVDIENVTEKDRDSYTDLVRRLRAELPADAEVSVAVAANPWHATTGWQGSYDYKALAEVSDYLMLMAYDESYPGDTTPGPVASIAFVENSLKALLNMVPAEKVVLGIPFYGRYWNGDPAFNGAGISNRLIDELISKYNGIVRYDTKEQSPVATFTIPAAQSNVASVYGHKLPSGSYTLWYENEQSIKRKLELVKTYGLKGTGSWSLNQEAPDTWSYYDVWLDGFYFSDVQGHWALHEVLAAANRGWMLGTAERRFEPDAALTRAQAAAILVRALGLTGEAGTAASFKDVPAAHWARHDIALAKQHGLIQGISDVSYAPDLPLTREAMSMLLTRALKLTSPASGAKLPYPDVPARSWSHGAIAALSARGLVDGFADGTFRPGAPLTRAQMAALLDRAAPLLSAYK